MMGVFGNLTGQCVLCQHVVTEHINSVPFIPILRSVSDRLDERMVQFCRQYVANHCCQKLQLTNVRQPVFGVSIIRYLTCTYLQ